MTTAQLIRLATPVVAALQAELPPPLRELACRLPVAYFDRPSPEILGQEFEPDILGLFVGPPHDGPQGYTNDVPAQILLFLGNIWDYAEGDPEAFADEVHLTYLHELGHYFGWDEYDLEVRGLE
jgi:predicted Zn-dependent protease with MMP-like domain